MGIPTVHHSQRGQVGLIVLDRPRSLNALDVPMVDEIGRILRAWTSSRDHQGNSPRAVCIMSKGAGEVSTPGASQRAVFCAGGDVKQIVQRGSRGDIEYGISYFNKEYHVDYMISEYPMPYVAIMDGITFGGGVGLAIHGTFQIATERTIFAMPECAIGLFPDIGGSYFLSRQRRGLGMYLGLTGARLHGIDVKRAGLATHYIHSSFISDLLRDLSKMDISCTAYEAERQIGIVLRRYENASHPCPVGLLDDGMYQDIEAAFGPHVTSVEDVFNVLEQHRGTSSFYDTTLELLHRCSPLSLKLTFELVRRGTSLPLSECFKMENRLVRRLTWDSESEFYIGVRAKLITRANELPRWNLPSLAHVDSHLVQQYFDSLGPQDELQLSSAGSIGSFLRKDMFQGRELMDIEEERVAESDASLGDFTIRQVFQNTTEDDTPFDMICCCPIGAGQYRAYKYEYPPPSAGCCCNTTDVCTLCSESNAFGSVCGSGQVCGILLLMSALIGTLAVTICVTGVFMARRRRQRRVTLDQFVSGHVPASQANRPSVQMIEIPNDQLKEIHIKQVPENEENGEAKECPICLDTVPVHTGIWSEFPCGHGSCTLCVNDLLRHSSRRVNSNTVAVLCPLCRTLAVAEMSSDNEPRIEVRDVAVEPDTLASDSDAHEVQDGGDVDQHAVHSNAMPSAQGHDDDNDLNTNNNNNSDDDALNRVETGQNR